MKKTVLRSYARLIARVGVNVRKGQEVIIQCDLDLTNGKGVGHRARGAGQVRNSAGDRQSDYKHKRQYQ